MCSLLGRHIFSRRLGCCRLHGVQPRDLLRCSRVIMYTVQRRLVLGLRMGLLHCLPSRVFVPCWCWSLLPLCCWDLRRGPGFWLVHCLCCRHRKCCYRCQLVFHLYRLSGGQVLSDWSSDMRKL